MNEQIRQFCRECLSCQTSKAGNKNVTPPMGSQKPMAICHFGLHWAITSVGTKSLLVATDVFSKFVLVQPFREAKAEPLVEFAENMIFQLFGVPEIILTDNGSQIVTPKSLTVVSRVSV
ncbi:uncharacterized protein LOC135704099 [Ochlerotatus camptorhynchus]|uniref:uncharacterized protein LOC135704099 n=1 Tax=Ochlerotatus camptorhynchus TaxID=644619 RepID=UPI0031DDF238